MEYTRDDPHLKIGPCGLPAGVWPASVPYSHGSLVTKPTGEILIKLENPGSTNSVHCEYPPIPFYTLSLFKRFIAFSRMLLHERRCAFAPLIWSCFDPDQDHSAYAFSGSGKSNYKPIDPPYISSLRSRFRFGRIESASLRKLPGYLTTPSATKADFTMLFQTMLASHEPSMLSSSSIGRLPNFVKEPKSDSRWVIDFQSSPP
jgi:hypothetical protein